MAIMSVLRAFRGLFQRKEQKWACLVARLVSIKIAIQKDPQDALSMAVALIDKLHKDEPKVFVLHQVSGLLSRAEMGCRILPEDPGKLSRIVDEIQSQLPQLPQFPLTQNNHDGGIKNAGVKLTPTNVLCYVEKTTQFPVYWDEIEQCNLLLVLAIIEGALIGRTGKFCFPRNVCETGFHLAEKALRVPELRADYEFPTKPTMPASSRSPQMPITVPRPKTSWLRKSPFNSFFPTPFARSPTSKEQPLLKEKSSFETLVEKPVGSENDDKSSNKQG